MNSGLPSLTKRVPRTSSPPGSCSRGVASGAAAAPPWAHDCNNKSAGRDGGALKKVSSVKVAGMRGFVAWRSRSFKRLRGPGERGTLAQ